MRALGLLLGLTALGCQSASSQDGPAHPREALQQWVRCGVDGVGPDATPSQWEAAVRQGLRRTPTALLVRGGRCEDSLQVGPTTPPCLVALKSAWGQFLAVAQRPGVDPIDRDIALRRVGDRYARARRECPGP